MAYSGASILIVEADAATLELYSRELGVEYKVRSCSDERAALEILRDDSISALIVEPLALQSDPWEFFAVMRSIPEYHRVPIVICSTVDERWRRAELGASAYLVKPVMPRELHLKVQQVMAEVGA